MRYETFKFIMDNQKLFLYDNAGAGGSDSSTDAGAATLINPNDYLAPVIGGGQLMKILVMVALVLGIIYLIKLNLKQ
jgi:hypothetical protein